MTPIRRPIAVLIVACLYIAVGVLGFAAHFHELLAAQRDSLWVGITESLAIVAAIFLLRGQNWARWLAVAWMVFHVIVSALHSTGEMAVHGLLCVGIAWLLFSAPADRYFQRTDVPST